MESRTSTESLELTPPPEALADPTPNSDHVPSHESLTTIPLVHLPELGETQDADEQASDLESLHIALGDATRYNTLAKRREELKNRNIARLTKLGRVRQAESLADYHSKNASLDGSVHGKVRTAKEEAASIIVNGDPELLGPILADLQRTEAIARGKEGTDPEESNGSGTLGALQAARKKQKKAEADLQALLDEKSPDNPLGEGTLDHSVRQILARTRANGAGPTRSVQYPYPGPASYRRTVGATVRNTFSQRKHLNGHSWRHVSDGEAAGLRRRQARRESNGKRSSLHRVRDAARIAFFNAQIQGVDGAEPIPAIDPANSDMSQFERANLHAAHRQVVFDVISKQADVRKAERGVVVAEMSEALSRGVGDDIAAHVAAKLQERNRGVSVVEQASGEASKILLGNPLGEQMHQESIDMVQAQLAKMSEHIESLKPTDSARHEAYKSYIQLTVRLHQRLALSGVDGYSIAPGTARAVRAQDSNGADVLLHEDGSIEQANGERLNTDGSTWTPAPPRNYSESSDHQAALRNRDTSSAGDHRALRESQDALADWEMARTDLSAQKAAETIRATIEQIEQKTQQLENPEGVLSELRREMNDAQQLNRDGSVNAYEQKMSSIRARRANHYALTADYRTKLNRLKYWQAFVGMTHPAGAGLDASNPPNITSEHGELTTQTTMNGIHTEWKISPDGSSSHDVPAGSNYENGIWTFTYTPDGKPMEVSDLGDRTVDELTSMLRKIDDAFVNDPYVADNLAYQASLRAMRDETLANLRSKGGSILQSIRQSS